jgi:hypothetical protein
MCPGQEIQERMKTLAGAISRPGIRNPGLCLKPVKIVVPPQLEMVRTITRIRG